MAQGLPQVPPPDKDRICFPNSLWFPLATARAAAILAALLSGVGDGVGDIAVAGADVLDPAEVRARPPVSRDRAGGTSDSLLPERQAALIMGVIVAE